MIFRNLINKFKERNKEDPFPPMESDVQIAALARELNCVFVPRDKLDPSSGKIYKEVSRKIPCFSMVI